MRGKYRKRTLITITIKKRRNHKIIQFKRGFIARNLILDFRKKNKKIIRIKNNQ